MTLVLETTVDGDLVLPEEFSLDISAIKNMKLIGAGKIFTDRWTILISTEHCR